MITRLDLQLFKCFELLKLPLRPLTLLSGSNASGKSSVLQALVLLQQTMRDHQWSSRLMLNGSSLKLGTVTDVVDKVNGRDRIGIGLEDDGREYEWSFVGERMDMSFVVDRVRVSEDIHEQPGSLQYLFPLVADKQMAALSERIRDLTYITAERVGPRESYPLEDKQTASVVGASGEHAPSLLYWGGDEVVSEGIALNSAPATRKRQVEERMCTFFPGCGIDLNRVAGTNALVLGIRTSKDTNYHRPIHVGYGLTQLFPIIVAALSAGRGDIMLIENPEVHLHPAGQAQVGQFLGEVVNTGVQVIIETHSDHVLNGVRRFVKAGRLRPEQVAVHFFRPRSSKGDQVVSPVLDRDGNIDAWPEGFFDQFDKDMNYFAGWGD